MIGSHVSYKAGDYVEKLVLPRTVLVIEEQLQDNLKIL